MTLVLTFGTFSTCSLLSSRDHECILHEINILRKHCTVCDVRCQCVKWDAFSILINPDWKSACEWLRKNSTFPIEMYLYRKIAYIGITFNLMVYEMDLLERVVGELYQIKWNKHKIRNGIMQQWANPYIDCYPCMFRLNRCKRTEWNVINSTEKWINFRNLLVRKPFKLQQYNSKIIWWWNIHWFTSVRTELNADSNALVLCRSQE